MQDDEPLLPFSIFHDRTYTIMTLVLMAMGFAMVGVFLPLTIYYQSVLGLIRGGGRPGDRDPVVRHDDHQSAAIGGAGGSGEAEPEVGAVRRAAAVRRRHGLHRV